MVGTFLPVLVTHPRRVPTAPGTTATLFVCAVLWPVAVLQVDELLRHFWGLIPCNSDEKKAKIARIQVFECSPRVVASAL